MSKSFCMMSCAWSEILRFESKPEPIVMLFVVIVVPLFLMLSVAVFGVVASVDGIVFFADLFGTFLPWGSLPSVSRSVLMVALLLTLTNAFPSCPMSIDSAVRFEFLSWILTVPLAVFLSPMIRLSLMVVFAPLLMLSVPWPS